MSHLSRTAVLIALLSVQGCATFRAGSAVEVSRAQLLKLSHNNPADCLWYKGSDDTYHYIFHNRTFHKTGCAEGSYKIPVEELPLKETFALGEGEYPLFTTTILEATAGPAADSKTTNASTADDADSRRS